MCVGVTAEFLLQGQTPFDVADEDILSLLEDLQKKQDDVSISSPVSVCTNTRFVRILPILLVTFVHL